MSGPPGPGPARVKLPPPGFHTNSAAPHQLPHTNLGYGGQGGYGAGPGLNLPPVSSNAVDSLFGLGPGPVRQRSGGPAPGFGGHAPQGAGQELLFGLGGGAKAGAGLDLGGPNRLGLGGLGGLGDRLFDQKQNHLGPHLQDNNGFANKDWQVRQFKNTPKDFLHISRLSGWVESTFTQRECEFRRGRQWRQCW